MYNRKEITQRARAAVGRPNVVGMCQAWTRGITGHPSVGDVDGDGDADAIDGWKSEPVSARHTGPAPEGVPGAWSGGSRGFGHRAISLGNDRWASTDAPIRGQIGIVNTAWFKNNWGMEYLGWSETMSGELIPKAPPVIRYSQLEVISWNVNRKSEIKKVRTELTKMITRLSPDVIYLYEGINLYGQLGGLGYKVYQLKPKSSRKGYTSNNGNIVALVRSDLEVVQSKVARMTLDWVGPKTGRNQDPRTFRYLKVKKQGVVWKVGGVHFPFGKKQQAEAVQWVRKLIKRAALIRPVVVLGDYNLEEAAVQDRIADPTDSKVAGEKIDLAVYHNCQLEKEQNLGKHGSDHPAWHYEFKKRRRSRKNK